jgi:hypothetical protein
MVAATAVAAGGDTPARSLRRLRPQRLPRPSELLACVGAALVACWPGTALSSSHLIVVSACFVPIGLRTLLRLEDSLVVPAPDARPLPGPADLAPVWQHTRTALALLDLAPAPALDRARPGLPRVAQANPAYIELAGGLPAFDPHALFVPSAAALVEAALAALGDARATTWTAVLGLAAGADDPREPRWAQLELTRLPDDEAGERPRIALGLVRREAPARSTHGSAPAGWTRPAPATPAAPAPIEQPLLETA